MSDELEKELEAAIAVMPETIQQTLQNIDPVEMMETMAWMSEDWLEQDKLFDDLGYPTQYPDGAIYPMADRFRDFCLNTGLDLKALLKNKDEEE